MEQLLKRTTALFSRTLLFVVIFSLSISLVIPQVSAQTQAETFIQGNTSTGNAQFPIDDLAANTISGCAASYIGGAISSAVSGLVYNVAPDAFTRVPTTSSLDNAQAGDSTGAVPSKDSVAYCIINAMITTLTDMTIEWINTGFDGNPAFVQNPEQFFADLADQEAAGFLQEIVGESTGIDICQPFRLNIVTGLSSQQTQGFGGRAQCTLGDIGSSFEDFQAYTSGNSPESGSLDAWLNMTQNPQNNPYGAYLLAQNELQNRIALQQNTANLDLTMGNGFLSFKKCSEDETIVGGNPDGTDRVIRGACGITTPGSVIFGQLENRLSSGNNRLVLADKFDQVVSALVDKLIKVALNETLGNLGQ